MIKRIFILALVPALLIFSGCPRKGSEVTIEEDRAEAIELNGKLEGGAGKIVLLEEMGAREFVPLDTSFCDENGRFHIYLKADQIAFYVLRYGESSYVTLLLEPGETLEFNGYYSNSENYTVQGSPGSELLHKLAKAHKNTLDALSEITRKNREMVTSPGYTNLKTILDLQFDSITSAFRDYSLEFIHQNSDSPAILVALYNLYGQGLPVFRPEIDFQVYQLVDSLLMRDYSGMEAVELLHAQVSQVMEAKESDPRIERLQVGEIAPDFVSSRPDGRQMALSDLKGNYVVLNFWAGWSRLSREENQTLRRAHDLYHKRPFRIMQVSLDDQHDIWLNAIQEDSLNWDHVSDLKRWETIVADLYQVDKIPSSLLINPEGRIVDTDLLGDRLLEKLSNLFSN